MLPDTMYDSAREIKFDVESADSASGTLDDLHDIYAGAPGVFTFRNGPLRDADFGSRVTGTPKEVTVDWTYDTPIPREPEELARWGGGTGWSGQPVIVTWPDSCMAKIRKAPGTLPEFGQREAIFGSLCGKVFFINFDTGRPSRLPIDAGNPIKGSMSLDPTLNGNLYVGHGVPVTRPFGAVVIDLYANKVSHTFAEDPKAPRHWGAYDSSPLRAGQFLFRPGENGRIYKYTAAPGFLKLHSAVSYRIDGAAPGIEASISAYRNYGFTADNAGNLICWNLNTLRPVWLYRMGDDTDCSPMILIEKGHPYIYCGSEIDKQGTEGISKFAKIDAMTGNAIWEQMLRGRRYDTGAKTGTKHFDGGFYASPVAGSGNCSGIVIDNRVCNDKGKYQNGEILAFDRKTGAIQWRTPMKRYAWSSPVTFLNEKGEMFVVTFDCAGRVYLINGKDGNVIYSASVGANFESSPAVSGNSLVIGSRGKALMRMSVR